ncbi:MAG: ABC transporter ATP-binding protein [Caldisericia bacterium]|nr:ABC transporter ATP-binding protein [Caldisericia bacterium]
MVGILDINNIHFSYRRGVEVLKGVSFSLLKGESLTIFGPNGSGKSTLIKIILGFIKPDEGSVKFEGREILKLKNRERARILSYVPQRPNLTFPLTVFNYVLLGRTPYINGFVRKNDYDKVLYWMDRVGILHLKDRDFLSLSEGEKQLALLSRVLSQETPIILLDEPLSHLDLRFRTRILKILLEVKGEGKSMISVFHHLSSVKLLSDRVIFLKDGRILEEGVKEEVITPENINLLFDGEVLLDLSG